MNRTVVGQASRLPLGRLAPESIAGETPAQAAGTAAPLPSRRFMVPMRAQKRKEAFHARDPLEMLETVTGAPASVRASFADHRPKCRFGDRRSARPGNSFGAAEGARRKTPKRPTHIFADPEISSPNNLFKFSFNWV